MPVVTSLGVRGCSYSLQTSDVNPVSFVSSYSAPSCTPPLVDNADPPVIKAEGLTIKYTYACNAGYTLLNVSNENSTLSSNNYTLSCVNGQLQGEVPVCTSESLFLSHHLVFIVHP